MTDLRPALAACLAVLMTACTPSPPETEVGSDTVVAEPALQTNTAPSAQPAPTAPDPAREAVRAEEQLPALAIDGEGLRLFNRENGSARPIPFGTPRAATLAAVAFRGAPALGTQNECGAGPLDFAALPGGLKLYFQRDRLAGWAMSGGGKSGVSTASGIGVGSSRSDLTDAYAATFTQTSLGTEFAAGDFYGLLDGPSSSARISDLWAGASCNFR